MRVGIDIVKISDFKKRAGKSGLFLGNIFTETELTEVGGNISRLAGWFAAKEAVMKALSLEVGKWKEIEIAHLENGRPLVKSKHLGKIKDCDLSISYGGEYAIAIFIISK